MLQGLELYENVNNCSSNTKIRKIITYEALEGWNLCDMSCWLITTAANLSTRAIVVRESNVVINMAWRLSGGKMRATGVPFVNRLIQFSHIRFIVFFSSFTRCMLNFAPETGRSLSTHEARGLRNDKCSLTANVADTNKIKSNPFPCSWYDLCYWYIKNINITE